MKKSRGIKINDYIGSLKIKLEEIKKYLKDGENELALEKLEEIIAEGESLQHK